MTSPRPRRQVAAFARLMEQELRENDHKGGWQDWDMQSAFDRLREEADELLIQITLHPNNAKQIGSEAADVANFAMMIADIAGALGKEARRE